MFLKIYKWTNSEEQVESGGEHQGGALEGGGGGVNRIDVGDRQVVGQHPLVRNGNFRLVRDQSLFPVIDLINCFETAWFHTKKNCWRLMLALFTNNLNKTEKKSIEFFCFNKIFGSLTNLIIPEKVYFYQ